jgi:WD40 repeat protein
MRAMLHRCTIPVIALFVVPVSCRCGEPVLKPVKTIGVGWKTDLWAWMGLVAFNRDGTEVASDGATSPGDTSENLSFRSFPEGRLVQKFPVRAVALSSDWKYYAGPHEIGEVGAEKPLLTTKKDSYPVFAFSPDSEYAVEGLPGKSRSQSHIRVIALPTGKEVRAFGDHQPFSIAVSPGGSLLAAGYWNTVSLWNMATGERIAGLSGIGSYVESLAFSADGKRLAAGTDWGGLELWDVESRAKIWSLKLDGGQVSPAAFSPDGQFVAIGIYGTGTAFLIDARTGKVLDRQKISDLGCGSVAFSPDGRYLIAPSTGGLIKWPYDRGGTIRVFEVNAP